MDAASSSGVETLYEFFTKLFSSKGLLEFNSWTSYLPFREFCSRPGSVLPSALSPCYAVTRYAAYFEGKVCERLLYAKQALV